MADKETRQRELKRIYEKHGRLQASTVIKEAKSKKSPIHDEFEWNNDIAGHKFRIQQANRLIRIVVFRDETGEESHYTHVPASKGMTEGTKHSGREGYYKPIKVVAENPDEFEAALKHLLAHMHAIQKSVNELKRAGRQSKDERVKLIPQLVESLAVARSTIQLMLKQAA